MMIFETRSILNFVVGIILGVVAVFMWEYDRFLYYTVFALQVITLYIIINGLTDVKEE